MEIKIFVACAVFYGYSQVMIYTDAHCHIVPNAYSPEIACRVFNAARVTDWEYAVDISERNDDKNFAAIGIHPWYITDAAPNIFTTMVEILTSHANIMIGEIGLDKFHPDLPRQMDVFAMQLDIAAQFRRPVHMHCVGAWDKVLHVFREHERMMPPVIVAHGFSGDKNQIPMLADKYNMYFSYSDSHDNPNSVARISVTPKNRILVESDTMDSDLELSALDGALDSVATAQHVGAEEISEQIYQNIQRIISYVRPID